MTIWNRPSSFKCEKLKEILSKISVNKTSRVKEFVLKNLYKEGKNHAMCASIVK